MITAKRLIQLSKVYVKIDDYTILTDINLDIHQNDIITIIGPNGAGKSTLIKTMLGLYQISAGYLYRAEAINMGYVPQRFYTSPLMPILVQDFLKLANLTKNIWTDLNKWTEIEPLLDKCLSEISGGELQRVLLTIALGQRPNVLILDEPTQGIDVNGQAKFYQLIANIKENYQCAIVIASHDLHFVMTETNQVICLNQHICCQGSPEFVKAHPEFQNIFKQWAPGTTIYVHHHEHSHPLSEEAGDKKSD